MILWNKDELRFYIWLVMDMLSLVFYFMVALLTMWGKEVLKWHFSAVQGFVGTSFCCYVWHAAPDWSGFDFLSIGFP